MQNMEDESKQGSEDEDEEISNDSELLDVYEIEQRRVFNRVGDQDRVKIPKSLFIEIKEYKGR